ncbi:hypothetical protein [Parapedobacter sp. DT-150]|uniref:hypothetical protein n=1 Tax=Parapedobacter sp. DT-150 TaxID=3396162 RepID=UPI003F53F634
MMYSLAFLLMSIFSVSMVAAQQSEAASPDSSWQTYGYIALGAIILAVAVVVLIRKQHRKFNE